MSREQDRARKKQLDAEVVDYINEKAKVLGETAKVRKNDQVAALLAKDTLFFDQLQRSLGQVFAGKLPVPKPSFKKKGATKRILNLIISDTHYQSCLDPREVGHRYGSEEEARRTAAVCLETAEYKPQYRDDTELYVHILGDIIQGQLHDPRDGGPLADQVAAASRILVQAIRFLALSFPKGVTVFTATGNHGRRGDRHPNRAVNQKWDSIETMVYVAIKEGVRNLPNVKFNLGYAPTYSFQAFDKVGYSTHGDTHLKPGFPATSINTKSLDIQACKINNTRVLKGEKPYNLFCVGHVHTGSMVHLPGGATIITNGCLIPPDAYANSINITDTECGMWLWESVPGFIVGDSRYIKVNQKHDQMSSLDQIIQPYRGLGD